MTDFFISYTSTDQSWAEWIGHVLEEEGMKVALQEWDFRPGSNFVLEMQNAAASAQRTLIVLSPDYLQSNFAAPEWAAAFARDPVGSERKLIPVMVRSCQPPGILRPIVHINLVGKDEAAARTALLHGLRDGRAKPAYRPQFPGPAEATPHPGFPGNTLSRRSDEPYYTPKMTHAPSDAEKRRFIRQAFTRISQYFEGALEQLRQRSPSVDTDFQLNIATDFTAELFVNGRSECRCHIWLGGFYSSDGISYAEGSTSRMSGAINDSLSISEIQGDLHLRSFMGIATHSKGKQFDLERMTPEEAAEYLWRRFVMPLEH